MKIKYLVPAFLLLAATTAFAQTKHISKLELKPKQVYLVGADNILSVDTLIMGDKSVIRFSPEAPGALRVGKAFVGEKCTIESRGKDGEHTRKGRPGTQGYDGGDLDIIIHFEELKSLIVDTQGGAGGNGLNGKNGKRGIPDRQEKKIIKGAKGEDIITYEFIPGIAGTNGTNASQGHKGGNGGDIILTYSTASFIPVFNHTNATHSITLLHTIGNTGKDGLPGKGGFNSQDGEVVYEKKLEPVDGQIRLIRADSATVKE